MSIATRSARVLPDEPRREVSTPEELRRGELAAFLRSRRERISPEQVGLPPAGRRRTPGLRREEVAQLARVGVSWYTWLEQARDIAPSGPVLDAVARTLLLDRHEREHLFRLSGVDDPVTANLDCPYVTPPVRRMLEQLDPYPAVVQNARFDLVAYNQSYRFIIEDLDAIAPEDRNTLWLGFTHPAWRRALVGWERVADRLVATFRASYAEHISEPAYKCLLKKLQDASPEFRRRWERHDVAAPQNMQKSFLHSTEGPLEFDYTNLWFGPRAGTRLITYVPADERTDERMQRLQLERVG